MGGMKKYIDENPTDLICHSEDVCEYELRGGGSQAISQFLLLGLGVRAALGRAPAQISGARGLRPFNSESFTRGRDPCVALCVGSVLSHLSR